MKKSRRRRMTRAYAKAILDEAEAFIRFEDAQSKRLWMGGDEARG